MTSSLFLVLFRNYQLTRSSFLFQLPKPAALITVIRYIFHLEVAVRMLYNKTNEYILRYYIIGVTYMTLSILDEHIAAHVAELFRAFSDTSRVRILSIIVKQEMNISCHSNYS